MSGRAASLRAGVIAALRTVYDPELPVDVYELGLIYQVDADADGYVDILMTLTTPNCPVAGSMPMMVKRAAESVEGVKLAQVELTWEPAWGPERMTEAARLQLNLG
ncbi:DUF59 domain-containing protein [Alkalilimnicola sp. S0819]|uniref:DUF59 domain-containing protein n=1 Tax=Alkalilimnicola sp. S0819 TaxID=2613922 RepID=UPI00126221AD|nr:DUF59 domain-containing protein [Alkalilimnicola sp. S0819]KAB7623630.1 DUF59 domain-containing protein [Alkalilimnicola sp. S0819]MPQ16754.1 DUF59 domain-containing protein [Alkalilimnicola sp. S0819]